MIVEPVNSVKLLLTLCSFLREMLNLDVDLVERESEFTWNRFNLSLPMAVEAFDSPVDISSGSEGWKARHEGA